MTEQNDNLPSSSSVSSGNPLGNPLGITATKQSTEPKRRPGRPPTIKVEVAPLPKSVLATKPVPEAASAGNLDEVAQLKQELAQIKEMITQGKTSHDGTSADVILAQFLEALRESKKPYKSDADKENERVQMEQMKKSAEAHNIAEERAQSFCKHQIGCNGLSNIPVPESAFTSIIWHTVATQVVIGICTVCQRQFWPTDPDYRWWKAKVSANVGSKAGDRDINVAQYLNAEHPEVFGTKSNIKPNLPNIQLNPLWING